MLILFLGDIACFILALAVMLFVRYSVSSEAYVIKAHIAPFSAMFLVWALAFFVAGLYDKQVNALKRRLFSLILTMQAVNGFLAVAFSYFLSFFVITPKTNLILYMLTSTVLVLLWRIYVADKLRMSRVERVLFVGDNVEIIELAREINSNAVYKMSALRVRDFNDPTCVDIGKRFVTVVADLGHKDILGLSPDRREYAVKIIALFFAQVKFIDYRDLYEEVFYRVPLSSVKEGWFLDNLSNTRRLVYDGLKRVMDVVLAIVLGVISSPIVPLVYLAIKLEDGGDALIFQDRIGQGGRMVKIVKFRSMRASDKGRWLTKNDVRMTKVGKFIRKTRLDELPQLWNVLKGDISLIGPRPDIINLGIELQDKIPYYVMRNLIKSGLSGWAQINQDLPPQSLEETRQRLAYDFYYLKNRSFLLDLEIALRTIKTLLSRGGL